MKGMLFLIYRICRGSIGTLRSVLDEIRTRFLFELNHVQYESGMQANGVPIIHVAPTGSMTIGNDFRFNNGIHHNRIGRQQRCNFMVGRNARLLIGNNVGMSSTAIVCMSKVTIGDNVKLGGNVVIYDTDFHALDAQQRLDPYADAQERKNLAVELKENVFIGAHSTILKGVTIGSNSIVGAGSLVSRSIPDNEIWGGNPAKFIRQITPADTSTAA